MHRHIWLSYQVHALFLQAQAVGTQENKWILVNIQNTTEFGCQVLNRDIWKDSTVKSLVKSHFVLWQVNYLFRASSQMLRIVHTSVRYFALICIAYMDRQSVSRTLSWCHHQNGTDLLDSVQIS